MPEENKEKELQEMTRISQEKMTNNIYEAIIKKIEDKNKIHYKPTKEFYNIVGIKQKRWGQILRNEHQPDIHQLKRLALFFNKEIDVLVNLPRVQAIWEDETLVMNKQIFKELENFEKTLGNKQKENFAIIMNAIKGENLPTEKTKEDE